MVLLLLLLAAVLEAGGDAMVRAGLHAQSYARIGLLVSGALAAISHRGSSKKPPFMA